jgi:hypothetical protein
MRMPPLLVPLATSLALAACGGEVPVPQSCSLSVDPPAATVLTCSSRQFTATAGATCSTPLRWTLQGSGLVAATGLYLAPQVLPAPAQATVTVKESSPATTSASAAITLATAVPTPRASPGSSADDSLPHHQVAGRGSALYAVLTRVQGSPAQYGLQVAASTDGGKTWGAPVSASDAAPAVPVSCASIALDAGDTQTVYVAYQLGAGTITRTQDATTPGGATLALSVSTDGGKTFTGRVLESHDSGWGECPDVTSPAPGKVLVESPSWDRGLAAPYTLFTAYLDEQKGAGFATGGAITPGWAAGERAFITSPYKVALYDGGSAGLESPRLGTDRSGGVCLAYVGGPSESDLRATAQCSTDGGKTFGDPADAEGSTPGVALHHPLALPGYGGTIAMTYWRSNDSGPPSDLRFAVSNDHGKTFPAPVAVPTYPLPASAGTSARPRYPVLEWEGAVVWLAYLVGDGVGNDRLVVDKTCSSGATWSGPVLINGPEPTISSNATWPGLLGGTPMVTSRTGTGSGLLPLQVTLLAP